MGMKPTYVVYPEYSVESGDEADITDSNVNFDKPTASPSLKVRAGSQKIFLEGLAGPVVGHIAVQDVLSAKSP